MQFSTVASIAAVAAVASATANVTATATEHTTTLVTITSCEDHKCEEHVTTAWLSTCTETISDIVTEYTTWCPIPTESAASSKAPHSEAPKNATTTTKSMTSYTGAAAKAFPAAGALAAGVAALLL